MPYDPMTVVTQVGKLSCAIAQFLTRAKSPMRIIDAGLVPESWLVGSDLHQRSSLFPENGVIGNFNRTCRKPDFAGVSESTSD
jgi:hypothetical protein